MKQLNPYIMFNGKAKEAMTFYKECIGGDLTIQTIGESPMAANMPENLHGTVLHSALTKDGVMIIMGTDMTGEEGYQPGNAIALCIVCSSKEEIEMLFSKLSEGGTVNQPLKEEFFGTMGHCTDKFGINWMLEFDDKPSQQ